MNRADFRKLLAYSDNCWRLLGETLATAPEAWNTAFETTSQWNTIRLLLAHCIAAEERLVVLRLQNLPLVCPYEERAAADWPGLYSDQLSVRAGTRAYIASVTDTELEGDEVVLSATAARPAQTRSDLLFQIVNHENFHRGQVITTLQRLGLDPPNFDYMLLKESAPG